MERYEEIGKNIIVAGGEYLKFFIDTWNDLIHKYGAVTVYEIMCSAFVTGYEVKYIDLNYGWTHFIDIKDFKKVKETSYGDTYFEFIVDKPVFLR